MIHHDGEEEEEEEDFSEDQELARYVEPPELPAFAMHKVFGKGVGTLEKRFLRTRETCVRRVFSSREMTSINHLYHPPTAAFWRIRCTTLTTKHSFLLRQLLLLRVCVRVVFSSSKIRRFVLGDDVLLLVQSDRVRFRTSGDIFHVLGIAGVRSKIEEKWRERDGD